MKKLKSWLTGLLLIQLLLAVALVWSNQWEARKNRPKPLLSIDWQAVDKMTIKDKHNAVTLIKTDNDWLIKDNKLPAKSDDVILLINSLKRLQTGWPVATSSGSHKRFDVSPDKYLRHIEFYQGDTLLGELFFGSSSGLHQSNVRRGDDDYIYEVPIDTVDILAHSSKWFDTSLLAAESIDAVKGPDYNIKQSGALWEFNQSGPTIVLGNTGQGQVDQERAEELVSALEKLTVLGWANKKPETNAPGVKQTKLEVSNGENHWIYRFILAGGKHYVIRNDRQEFFTVDKALFENITSIRQAYLKKKPELVPGDILKETPIKE